MREELFEIVFENIDILCTYETLKNVLQNSKIERFSLSFESSVNEISPETLDILLEEMSKTNQMISIYFSEFEYLDFKFKEIGLRLALFDFEYYLEFNFCITLDQLENELHYYQNFAISFANSLDTKDYYAGLEPATDLDTRIFTKTELGPFLS